MRYARWRGTARPMAGSVTGPVIGPTLLWVAGFIAVVLPLQLSGCHSGGDDVYCIRGQDDVACGRLRRLTPGS